MVEFTKHICGSHDLSECNQNTLLKDGAIVLPTLALGRLQQLGKDSWEVRVSERLWMPSIFVCP